jgi:hypothetical protein
LSLGSININIKQIIIGNHYCMLYSMSNEYEKEEMREQSHELEDSEQEDLDDDEEEDADDEDL